MVNSPNLGTLSIGDLVTITDRFIGLLGQVKDKLIRQPNPAHDKLAVVLGELSKIFLALDTALTDYLSILFDPTQPLYKEPNRQDRRVLIGLEGRKVETEMKAARSHCGKIGLIYEKYLHKWFADLLSKDEGNELEYIFRDLEQIDGLIIRSIEGIAAWLSNEAKETNALVSQRALAAANARLEQARIVILPYREQLSAIVGQLHTMEAEFIRVSGALGS